MRYMSANIHLSYLLISKKGPWELPILLFLFYFIVYLFYFVILVCKPGEVSLINKNQTE